MAVWCLRIAERSVSNEGRSRADDVEPDAAAFEPEGPESELLRFDPEIDELGLLLSPFAFWRRMKKRRSG